MPLGVTLSLMACVLWGTSDFLGGLASRRLSGPMVLAVSQSAGLIGIAVIAAFRTEAMTVDATVVFAGTAAGLCDAVGYLALYQAMRRGLMGIVAPISALGVAVPVVVDLAGGGRLGVIAIVGLALAGIGGVLIAGSAGGERRLQRETIRLAVLAAGGFGAGFVFVAMGADHDPVSTTGVMRMVSVPLAGAALFLHRRGTGGRHRSGPASWGTRPTGAPAWEDPHPVSPALVRTGLGLRTKTFPVWTAAITCGLADLLGGVSFGTASTEASLATTSMLGSMYPVVTVLLARLLLAERLCQQARWGAWACLAGTACLAAGTG